VSAGSELSGNSPTLTFLFTDIERHSELWDRHPDAMSTALREHDDLIASAVTEAGGVA
jgi:class 3 adenylate cyclase